MHSDKPAIKPELLFCEENVDTRRDVVVKDPTSRRYFKLDATAARVATLLDGERSLDEITEEVHRRFGVALTKKQIDGLVCQLERMGLIQGAQSLEAPPKSRQSLLAFRVGLVNPDRLLGWLEQHLRFVYTRPFFIVSAILILSAVCLYALKWRVWASELQQEMGYHSLVTIYLPALSVMVLHEMAHGLTCKHFGCSVKEMGAILYYLQPCTYCDVTDSWMLSRKKRIYVMISGVFFEALIWSLAVFTKQLAVSGTIVSEVALGLVLTSGIKCLFNFNPLIKLDGYYILSDLVDIPNLRSLAFSLPRLMARGSLPGNLSRFQLAVLLVYAPVSLVFSFAILLWFGWWTYDFLDHRFGAAGRLLFWGGAALVSLAGVFLGKVRTTTWRESSRPSHR